MTDHRIAELDDLDRADMETLPAAEFSQREAAFLQIIRERFAIMERTADLLAAERERKERRAILIFALKWALVMLCGVAVALYLKSIGQ